MRQSANNDLQSLEKHCHSTATPYMATTCRRRPSSLDTVRPCRTREIEHSSPVSPLVSLSNSYFCTGLSLCAMAVRIHGDIQGFTSSGIAIKVRGKSAASVHVTYILPPLSPCFLRESASRPHSRCLHHSQLLSVHEPDVGRVSTERPIVKAVQSLEEILGVPDGQRPG